MINILCPSCKHPLSVEDKYLGQTGKCAKCGGVIRIPEDSLTREEEVIVSSPQWPSKIVSLILLLFALVPVFALAWSNMPPLAPYLAATVQGNADAQFNLARMYATGDGIEKDGAEAIKWYTAAAEQGHTAPQDAR